MDIDELINVAKLMQPTSEGIARLHKRLSEEERDKTDIPTIEFLERTYGI